jgi:hypothetical protein
MKRREFIAFLGGTAVAWPMAARAKQLGGPKRVGLLAAFSDDHDPLVQRYLSAFKQRLHELGKTEIFGLTSVSRAKMPIVSVLGLRNSLRSRPI